MSPFRARRLRRSLATHCLITCGSDDPENLAGAKPVGRLTPARVPHPGTSRNGAKTRLRPARTVFPVGAGYCVLRPPHPFRGAIFDCVFPRQFTLGLFPACLPGCPPLLHPPHSFRCPTTRLEPGYCAYLSGNSAIRRCMDRSLPRRQQSSATSTNVTVTSRHLFAGNSPSKVCQAWSAFPLTAPPNPVAGMLLAEPNWICWRKSA